MVRREDVKGGVCLGNLASLTRILAGETDDGLAVALGDGDVCHKN